MGTWRGSMLAAFAATLAHPAWWSMALAGFLVRGGIVLVFVPLVAIPTFAELSGALSPTVSAIAFGGITPGLIAAVVAITVALVALLCAAALTGAWLDLAQLREAAADEELDLHWAPVAASLREAVAVRLAAHVPTLAVAAYAAARLIGATYDELFSAGDQAVQLWLRIVARAPETVPLLVVTWLAAESIGAQAARGSAARIPARVALAASARQLLRLRGLATLALTTAAVAAALVALLFLAGNAWRQLARALLGEPDPVAVGAALLVLVTAWILGLSILAMAVAWRTAAWTAEVAPVGKPVPEAALITAEA